MTLGQRIIEARKARNLSRRQLSELSGVGYPTLAGIENDAQKTSTQLPDLAQALQVNIGWLHTGKGERDLLSDPDQWAEITRWKQPLAAGDGSQPEDYAETGGLKFKRSSLQRKGLHPDKLAVLHASGDSMSPRIQDGDALLLDLSDTLPLDDHIYALQYDGQLYVKRLRRFGQQWFLVSDNPHDPKWRDPQPVDTRHDFQIIGRVRWIGSWED